MVRTRLHLRSGGAERQDDGVGVDVGRRSWQGRRMALAFAVLAGFTGGACGSGGSDEAGAGAGGAAPTSAASPLDQDRATARRAVQTPADVPSLPPAGPPARNRLYAQCGLNPLLPGGDDPRQAPPAGFLKDETAEAQSPQTTAVASSPRSVLSVSTLGNLLSALCTCLLCFASKRMSSG